MDKNGKPKRDRWSFEEDNRKKIPKEFIFPNRIKSDETKHTKHLKEIIEEKFKDHVGSTDDFWLCTTRQEAWKLFNNFIKEKINLFGDYEDAVDQRNNFLFHSTARLWYPNLLSRYHHCDSWSNLGFGIDRNFEL